VVVQNVETLVNIAAAADGHPVTRKIITIAGAVGNPASFDVPLGISLRECIEAAGGASVKDVVIAIGGMMMGETTADLDRPVTKTTAGAIVLPADHPVVMRKLKPASQMAAIGKSACDQCRYCTEFCPRYLLGYAVEPHQVMRSLGFTATGSERFSEWASLCCSCGLCTLYACPEALYPKEACDDSKAVLRKLDWKWSGPQTVEVHPMLDGRRVPINSYDSPAPLHPVPLSTTRAVMPLKQHAGAPAIAKVRPGQVLCAGEVIAEPAPDVMGAVLHAPFASRVEAVESSRIILSSI
jgi:Na+-translocating ferredoxin:NAD+ oxidoreductase RnfC subunit